MSNELVSSLRGAGVVKFGDYHLKSGQYSPVYIDCRVLISSPKDMERVCCELWTIIQKAKLKFDYICGVPHGAVPYASVLSVKQLVPMLMRRKEVKDYGTKKRVEGVFEKGKTVLVLEDVTTSGSSIMETVEVLRAEGLVVNDAVVLLDRGQGAASLLSAGTITLHPVLTLADVLAASVASGELTRERADAISRQLAETTPGAEGDAAAQVKKPEEGTETLESRLEMMGNEKAKRILELMIKKKSNLCVAADFTSAEEVLQLAKRVGESVVLFKIHANVIGDFTADFAAQLRVLANDLEFMIFEDRKYADTGRTVELELTGGRCAPAAWADLVTVHATAGGAPFEGCRRANKENGVACLLVAEMSVDGALAGTLPGYVQQSVELAEKYRELVAGFICQRRCSKDPSMIYITPGVHLSSSGDDQLQRWRSPRDAILRDRNDIVVVGRGVTQANDVKAAVKEYRDAAWTALQERIGRVEK